MINEILIPRNHDFFVRNVGFTFHLFYEKDLKGLPENSWTFACAVFLPGGNRALVGRVPIDDYKEYRLSFSYEK